VAPPPTTTDQPGWWRDRVFYEAFVRSFSDSNGDGVGDLAGLTAKLSYLNDGDPATDGDLGVDGVWLMPIFPSPSYHGYDVSDYRAINPAYGTLAESCPSTRARTLRQVFAELAAKFTPMVDALNEISESSYQHSDQDRLRLYELWVKTGSERSRTLLRKLGLEPAPAARSPLAH